SLFRRLSEGKIRRRCAALTAFRHEYRAGFGGFGIEPHSLFRRLSEGKIRRRCAALTAFRHEYRAGFGGFG
ncbi:hypothetical protein BWZ30_12360, partial [Neisseria meningitidis]